jgi:hypothetical protein
MAKKKKKKWQISSSLLRCSGRLYLQLFVGGFMSYLRCSGRLYLQLFVGGFMSYLRCSGRLYLQLFVGGFMSYLPYLCLFVYSGVCFLSSSCTICCQFHRIVQFWLPLRCSLTYIWRYIGDIMSLFYSIYF